MKTILTIALLYLSYFSNGKSLQEIKELLAVKKILALKAYIQSKTDGNLSVFIVLDRELTLKYHETVIDINEKFQDSQRPGLAFIKRYRINILADSTDIIYYDFGKKQGNGGGWDDFSLDISDSFKNEELLNDFGLDFKSIFKSSVNMKELFIDSIVYGFSCSYSGERPKFRKELDVIVKSKDYKTLNEWIRSPNTEKQLYGIDGLYQLRQNGHALTIEETQIVEFVRLKKGNVRTCSGCLYSNDTIGEVVNNILAEKKM